MNDIADGFLLVLCMDRFVATTGLGLFLSILVLFAMSCPIAAADSVPSGASQHVMPPSSDVPEAAALLDSFITPDFLLHEFDPDMRRDVSRMDADTLGNFYIGWREMLKGVEPYDQRVVITKVRYDGTVEYDFVVIHADSTPGFQSAVDVSVAPSGGYFAVGFSRFFDSSQSSKGAVPALPAFVHSMVQLFDSSGTPLTPELYSDSASVGSEALHQATALTSNGVATIWRQYVQGDGIGSQYTQFFDLSGARIAPEWRCDSCVAMTCLWGQVARGDSRPGGFVVTWDELVVELGSGAQRPLFRIFDSLGMPVIPVAVGPYQDGYVADCEGSSPGYQGGYGPDVAVMDDGQFMLVWACCDSLDFFPWGAKAWGQTYYPDGSRNSGLLMFADVPPGDGPDVRVAAGDDGNFYVLWADTREILPDLRLDPMNLWVQRVAPDGTQIGPDYIINDAINGLGSGFQADIAVSNGRACIIWWSMRNYPDPAPNGEFYAQVVSLDMIGHYVHGDVNLDYQFTSADVIYLVNYVFKSGQRPLPGKEYGDVNGDCVTSSADIIRYVNYVFKGGDELRDPCTP